jgi:hypothetical protein
MKRLTGDLAVGSGADTAAKLAKGADGTLLRMASGSIGWGLLPYVGACASTSGAQTITRSAYCPLALDTEASGWDTHAFHDTSTNNSRFTIPAGKGGKYLVTVSGVFASGGTMRGFYVYVDGTITSGGRWELPTSLALQASMSCVVSVAAGSYIEGHTWTDSGSGTDTTVTGATVSISLLGA